MNVEEGKREIERIILRKVRGVKKEEKGSILHIIIENAFLIKIVSGKGEVRTASVAKTRTLHSKV